MTTVSTRLDLRNRQRTFRNLEGQPFDVLIIGAGITGCGIARDAAMRGLRVALVDAGDIGSGTSGRSSKLVHGGARYLAQKDLAVVREAANERRILREIAPHLAQMMPIVIPVRKKSELAQLKAGMWTYEKLGQFSAAEKHQFWEPSSIREEEPAVITDDLLGAIVYPECLTDDFRLTLANARSAASFGAQLITYAAVDQIITENARAVGAVMHGRLAGESAAVRIRAGVVVNAAGPWVDAVRCLEDPNAQNKLVLTKGIHIVIPKERLPITRTVIMEAPDKRANFAIPRENHVYIGTTDTFYPAPVYWPEITREDVVYLLDPLQRRFCVPPIDESDIVSAWAGLRPMLQSRGKKPSEISRKHETIIGAAGMLTIAGGKLTSYRSMAERVVQQCEKQLNRTPTSTRTGQEPLPGGDFSESIPELQRKLAEKGLSPRKSERAVRLFGSEALEIFSNGPDLSAEIRHAVENEGALTLEDYWFRRSALARFAFDDRKEPLEQAADQMGALLGWTDPEKQRQLANCLHMRTQEMGFQKRSDKK